jgi:hypothetical protein
MSSNQLPPYSLFGTFGIYDHAIAMIALYAHGSERVRNHRMELATPDLDLIKQAEQGRIMNELPEGHSKPFTCGSTTTAGRK